MRLKCSADIETFGCRIPLDRFGGIGRIEKIFETLPEDPLRFTLFMWGGRSLFEYLYATEAGTITPVFECMQCRDKVDIGNLGVRIARCQRHLSLTVNDEGIQKEFASFAQPFFQRLEGRYRIASMIKDAKTEERIELLFIEGEMFDTEQLIAYIALYEAVDQIKLRQKER